MIRRLLQLLRFMRRNNMLNVKYAVLLVRLGYWKLRLRRRLELDGMAFIGPGSEWFWTAVSGVVLAVTFLAAYIPARQASRVNPMKALRYE